MKRLWQRHMLVRAADKERCRDGGALEAIGGMMGGFMQGMLGGAFASSMQSPEMVEKFKVAKERPYSTYYPCSVCGSPAGERCSAWCKRKRLTPPP